MSESRVVHFEIPAEAPERLTRFYSELFGWKFTKAPMPGPEYWLCETGTGQPGIDGGVAQRQHPAQSWMNYVGVDDLDAAVERALGLGATLAVPKTPVPRFGEFAAIADPEGNVCGLWRNEGSP